MTASFRERNIDLSIGYASAALFGISIAVLIRFLLARVDRPEPMVGFFRREIERATDGRGDARATCYADSIKKVPQILPLPR